MGKKIFLMILSLLLISSLSFAQTNAMKTISFKTVTYTDNSHKYFEELLEKGMKDIGYKVVFKHVGNDIPQKRILAMLENGQISINRFIKKDAKDKMYVPVNVGVTNGLIGKRVLFIPRGKQYLYNNVKTLNDFRKLGFVAGFGARWFDINVWKANELKYREMESNWRNLYDMLAVGGRGVDYFSRGVIEILEESKFHPNLDIEKNIMLVYNRDFIFYLSKKESNIAEKAKIVEKAMKKAKESGLIDELVKKYWTKDFEVLNIKKRRRIDLVTP